MKTLKDIITLVHEIDNALDAYEYTGYTYDEYIEAKNKNIRGERSLRHLYRNGSHVWNNMCENALKKTKETINDLYRNIIDKESINKTIDKLNNAIKTFKKHTDDYSIYPIKSEFIGNSLFEIIKYFNKYI